jgi:hypothetical protein
MCQFICKSQLFYNSHVQVERLLSEKISIDSEANGFSDSALRAFGGTSGFRIVFRDSSQGTGMPENTLAFLS